MTEKKGTEAGRAWHRRAGELIRGGIRDRRAEPLAEAAELLAKAAAADPERRGRYAADLGVALTYRFELTGDLGSLRGALAAHRVAVDAAPGSPSRLSNLGLSLTRWFERTGETDRLAEGISVLRDAAAAAGADDSRYASYQSNLGLALTRWSERTGDASAAREAVDVHTEAVGSADGTPSDVAARLANLGMALMVLFRATGDKEHLLAAVDAYRKAVLAVPPGDGNAPGCYAGLGDALTAAAVAGGDVALHLDAMEELRTVVDGLGPDDPDAPLFLNQFANALRAVFVRTGDTLALDEAVTWRRAALARTPAGPDRLLLTANLALSLRSRFEYTQDLAVLRDAVGLLEEVLAASEGDLPERVKWEADLGNCLYRLGVHEQDADVLDRAAAALRQAAASADATHPDVAMHLANLGGALVSRVELRWEPALQSEAVEVLGRALDKAVRKDMPSAEIHLSLGLAHRTLFLREGSPGAYRDAVHAFGAAAGASTAAGRTRARAAQHLGRLHVAAGDVEAGLTALTTALELLDLVAWHGLERDDQERYLADFRGLGSAAAACALTAGDHQRALGVLEQGRGVLLGQVLDVRTDHDELRAHEPGLAAELAEVHAAIEAAATGATAPEPPVAAVPPGRARPGGTGPPPDRRRSAARRDDLLARIRRRPRFARFLLAPDAAALRPAAGSGPTVTLNVSPWRCDALVTTGDGTEVVPLESLTAQDAAERAGTFVAAVNANSWGTNDAIRDVLAWLWEAVTEPVFRHLGLTASDSPALPHLWWVPTGPLSVLPLHAAGLHTGRDGDRNCALHRVASSYTPTLRFLRHIQDRPTAGEPESALVVAVGTAAAPLAMAEVEADLVAAEFAGRVVRLAGGRATKQAVLDGLGTSAWAHFACHSISDAEHPSDSCLRLSDGDLRVRDIAALRLPAASVAYLSACTTALSGGHLPDETIHISSAFQLAGFSTAIGTLWRVPDLASQETARITYTALADHPPARAVNLAAREMRRNYRMNPYEWAAFVHSGPA
ncbi:CHAT domain-containing protein [Streptomyces sp. NBC_01477]|uniref:CHAT domain-containing protein n=1 Tax=Streptomyces sp. NBC_01477 TaxID=2976015 RepID=UPI002E309010|nr:CHAT domain-containing protein [Streptomyces sp. NBC_01477]